MSISTHILFLAVSMAALILPDLSMGQDARNSRVKKPEKPTIVDLLLGREGTLEGQLKKQGEVEDDALISIWQGQKLIWKGTADQAGKFQLKNITTGLYRVVYGDETILFRAWSGETAPPKSSGSLILHQRKRSFDLESIKSKLTPTGSLFPPIWSGTHDDPRLPNRP
ncbi:hypothetical protein [Planctomicrobium sp. SH527]|uniref:hypothetical protein n=1 Tax=Planctomicrobium sp. SH527 TaxID=3448123 RepID=UPI003F5BC82E